MCSCARSIATPNRSAICWSSYLGKYREATSHDTINSAPADARIVSRATVSNVPAYPKKLPTILIATIAMLTMSSGLVITKEILAAPSGFVPLRREPALAVADDEPVPAAARLNAVIGARHSEPLRRAAEIPMNAVADAAYDLDRLGVRRIAVFGAAPGMNTGQSAIKLARALAEELRVILIGLASGETAIRAISNEPSADGLAELAHGLASFRDIITKDRLSPLHLIAPGHASTDRLAILRARHRHELRGAGAELRSRRGRRRHGRRRRNRSHCRDRPARGAGRRDGGECGLRARTAPVGRHRRCDHAPRNTRRPDGNRCRRVKAASCHLC